MAFMERQKSSFATEITAAANKIGGGSMKRTVAPPAAKSPNINHINRTPASSAPTTPTKNSRHNNDTVYSQPANTGLGTTALTQATFVIDWLKTKNEAKSLGDILSHLSLWHNSEAEQRHFAETLRNHNKIQWIPDPSLSEQTWRSGTYAHQPTIPGVRSATTLLRYLQQRPDAAGVLVKDLKDGWPECDTTIAELERDMKLLVVRTKKDNHARAVWLNDPSLTHAVDPEFRALWHRVELPHPDSLVLRLQQVGQKPTSEDPRLRKKDMPKVDKKKKKARRQIKTTNTHMDHILKDYSYVKR